MSNLCECGCGQETKPGNRFIYGHYVRVNNPMHNPEVAKRCGEANKGKHNGPLSEETKRKMSEALKNPSEETRRKIGEAQKGNKYSWNEDCDHYGYYHVKAGKLYRKDKCEICGFIQEEHLELYNRRFDMHCISKVYSDMSPENWQTLCIPCHNKIEGK